MNALASAVDTERALQHLLDLLAIEGLSGREGNVAKAIREKLIAAGCKPSWIGHDRANRSIPGDYEVGNLIVKIPGTRRGAPRILFMGHMDTVPLCRGAVPKVKGERIVSEGNTALGGDNRTACAALVTLAETLLASDASRPPITLMFTVGEEVGLWGARMCELKRLGNPAMGFNVDGGAPAGIIHGAIGADRWECHVHGRSSHAGVSPEDGISSALIASRAITEVAEKGYFGKIVQGNRKGTSNVGTISGGEASNQVTDYVIVRGESRSHSLPFVDRITGTYRKAFEKAAKATKNASGVSGTVDFRVERDYDPFKMPKSSPPVKIAVAQAKAIGLDPITRIANGGLDANYLNAKGLETVTLGAGQHNPHTVDEYVEISEYLDGCRLLAAIASA